MMDSFWVTEHIYTFNFLDCFDFNTRRPKTLKLLNPNNNNNQVNIVRVSIIISKSLTLSRLSGTFSSNTI